MIENIRYWTMVVTMILLSITILALLVRAYIGPRFTDRVLAVNVINVKVIVLICILAVMFEQNYIVDIAILYALFSFLSVIVLSRIYLNDYLDKQNRKIKEGDETLD